MVCYEEIEFLEGCIFHKKNTQVINEIIREVVQLTWQDMLEYNPFKDNKHNKKIIDAIREFKEKLNNIELEYILENKKFTKEKINLDF